LLKLKPLFVFSKGGFVSVPPVIAAKILKIPVYTHECDFSPGLATRINSKFAKKILLSFESTSTFFSGAAKEKLLVTGNPVRPVFYNGSAENGKSFIGYDSTINKKPILLVMGGSLGAVQINSLVKENLDWLKERFFVVHQTGKQWAEELLPLADSDYHPFAFIYNEMPNVVAAADLVFSRAGSNSLWECAVSKKPLVLVPFSGSGTRGDQVENAAFFEKNGAAIVLGGKHSDGTNTQAATSENLKSALTTLLDENKRKEFSLNVERLVGNRKPAEFIANLIYGEVAEKL
jgi:UDP-N-acetylglucosamine--N-acetylmuramyl-(pentapeptide) pyrophosphoryl-undecaprenol N-acetylglucosamine transferase